MLFGCFLAGFVYDMHCIVHFSFFVFLFNGVHYFRQLYTCVGPYNSYAINKAHYIARSMLLYTKKEN